MSPRADGAEDIRSVRLDATLYPPATVTVAYTAFADRCEFASRADGTLVVQARAGAGAAVVDEFLNCALRLAVEAHLGKLRSVGAPVPRDATA